MMRSAGAIVSHQERSKWLHSSGRKNTDEV
jgi:hypothetical protein